MAKKFLDDSGLKTLVKKMQGTYAQNFQSTASSDANAGQFTFETFDTDTQTATTHTVDTNANKVVIATGTTSGNITVTTNGTAAQVAVKDVLTTDGAQNITGTKTVTTGNKLVLVDAPVGNTDAANKKYVDDKIAAADAMVYRGLVYPLNDSDSGHNHLPTSGVVVGDTYKAAGTTAGSTYATGVTANLGDLIIAKTVTGDTTQTITWDVIESGNDIVGVTAGTGLSGGGTSGTVTLNHSNSITAGSQGEDGSTRTLAEGGTFKVPKIAYDTEGHIVTTGTSTVTLTMPSAYTEGKGIDITNKKISVDVTANKGLGFSANTDAGTLEIKNGDSLEFTNNGALEVAIARIQVGSNQGEDALVGLTILEEEGGGSGHVSASGLAINAGNGLDFDSDGKLTIKAGGGLGFSDKKGHEGEICIPLGSGNGLDIEDGYLTVIADSGIDFDANGKVIVKIDSSNANGLSVSANGLAMAKGSTSTLGTVKVTDGNGLSIDNTGTISMAVGTNSTTGAVKVTNGNGLAINNSTGEISMSVASGSAAGAMSAADYSKLSLLQALPTAVGTYTYNVTTAGTAGTYTAMQFVTYSGAGNDIDAMWAGTYTPS